MKKDIREREYKTEKKSKTRKDQQFELKKDGKNERQKAAENHHFARTHSERRDII
jgi:hypothetical protein